ncbi:MAG TPA: ABC transporter permease [Candidatus Thermoplasmatota archaeon]|nr:ABC transporter permease [Candidatus Thermoplasmatota archaeon]
MSNVFVIEPPRRRVSLGLREMWRHRELLYFLAWRDVKVRYKQTVLGLAWAVLQPLLLVVVFTLFFGRLAGIPSDGVPYVAFALSGLVLWTSFMNGLMGASNSLVEQQSLITKVYFPRNILPIAPVAAALVDLVIASGLLVGLILLLDIPLAPRLVLAPFFAMLAILTAVGLGLWLAGLNAKYRDVRYIVPFFMQLLLFAGPIAYPSSLVPDAWKAVYYLNPMAAAIDGWRWAWLGTSAPTPYYVISCAVALALVVFGFAYFRAVERNLADVV